MASVQAALISGRYRIENLVRHWSPGSNGFCQLSDRCNTPENIQHFLQHCLALQDTRTKLLNFTQSYCNSHPEISAILMKYCNPNSELFTQFLIDCSTLPEVIRIVQTKGKQILTEIFTVTRIWCYTLHRERLKILGRWRNFAKS